MVIVTAIGLTQYRMMRIAPERSARHQPFIRFRAWIVCIPEPGARFEDWDFFDKPARWDAIDKHAAALSIAQNRVIIIELSRRDVNLLRGSCSLRRGLLLFARGIGVASGEYKCR